MDNSTLFDGVEINDEWQSIDGDNFNHYNTELDHLILNILLQGFYQGKVTFLLSDFIKGNYSEIPEIQREFMDTNDYASIEDFVLSKTISIINDLQLGKIESISINSVNDAIESVIRKAVMETDRNEENVQLYATIIDELFKFKKINEENFAKMIEDNVPSSNWRKVIFTEENYHRNLEYSTCLIPQYIHIEIKFNDDHVRTIHENLNSYIESFGDDEFIEKGSFYQEKRFYFSKQLENFFTYIEKLPILNGWVNIPFEVLKDERFEVVKVLSFLSTKKRIQIRTWDDETDFWNIRFYTLPITLNSLFGAAPAEIKSSTILRSEKSEIKFNLNFSLETGILILTDSNGTEYKIKVQGQVQREVLRVIFEKPENAYSAWSLYEISDRLGADDVDVVAVKNAISHFNTKVRLAVPQIKKLFDYTKHSAQLNPEYINKS